MVLNPYRWPKWLHKPLSKFVRVGVKLEDAGVILFTALRNTALMAFLMAERRNSSSNLELAGILLLQNVDIYGRRLDSSTFKRIRRRTYRSEHEDTHWLLHGDLFLAPDLRLALDHNGHTPVWCDLWVRPDDLQQFILEML